MYALFESGGQQHKAVPGSRLRLQKLEVPVGESVTFEKILMLSSDDVLEIGAPFVTAARVEAQVVAQGRGPKIRVVKFRRRKNSKRMQGHRQDFTEVLIQSIQH